MKESSGAARRKEQKLTLTLSDPSCRVQGSTAQTQTRYCSQIFLVLSLMSSIVGGYWAPLLAEKKGPKKRKGLNK